MSDIGHQLGKYTVQEKIGQGGFGTVYKAKDPIGRTVALKVLKSSLADDPGVLERFRREALAAGSLFHPRIATILDFDQADGRTRSQPTSMGPTGRGWQPVDGSGVGRGGGGGPGGRLGGRADAHQARAARVVRRAPGRRRALSGRRRRAAGDGI